jgi:hypothetical protein
MNYFVHEMMIELKMAGIAVFDITQPLKQLNNLSPFLRIPLI